MPCYDLLVQVLPATEPMQGMYMSFYPDFIPLFHLDFIIFLLKFYPGNCKDNLNTWKDKADERRREMAALEVKISEENSKEKKVEGNIILVFRNK